MSYTTIEFAVFVAVVGTLYFITPGRFRWVCLLVASYAFYYIVAGVGAIAYIAFTTVTIFLSGHYIGKLNAKYSAVSSDADSLPVAEGDASHYKKSMQTKKRIVFLCGLLSNFGILAFLKYTNFFIVNINHIFESHVSALDLLLPLGISFYTFQSIGYLIDVYRGKYAPDENIFRFALFVSFFPQIVQGPISRYDQLAEQLYAPNKFELKQVQFGLQLILWGLFKKLVIADRAFVLVDQMLNNVSDYSGFEVVIGTLAYMFELYADFSGGIDISIGIAQMLGITMVENFKRPYFAISLPDYWRRWHITLGTWMRDYLFYPVTLSPGFSKFHRWSRKHLGNYLGKILPATIGMGIVFFTVGVWHGAAWKFIAYGVYNAIIIMVGMLVTPGITKWNLNRGFVDTKVLSWRIFCTSCTFVMLFFGKIFTMAQNFTQARTLIASMFSKYNPWIFFDGSLYELGLNDKDFRLLVLSIFVLIVVSLIQEKGIKIRESLAKQNLYFRWLIYLSAIFAVIIFGMYGAEAAAPEFIYKQF